MKPIVLEVLLAIKLFEQCSQVMHYQYYVQKVHCFVLLKARSHWFVLTMASMPDAHGHATLYPV